MPVETLSAWRRGSPPGLVRRRYYVGLTLSLALHVLMSCALVEVWLGSDTVTAPDLITIDGVGMIDDPSPPDRPESPPNPAAPEPVQPATEPPPSPPPPAPEPPPPMESPLSSPAPPREPPPPTVVQQPAPPKPSPPKPRTEPKPLKRHGPPAPPRAEQVLGLPPVPRTPTVTTAPPSPSPPVVRQSPRARSETVQDYGRVVWARISHHKPRNVTFRGSTLVSFALAPDGSLISVSVERTSGNASLDQSAVAAVRAVSPFPQPPADADPGELVFTISFDFR